MESDFQIFIFKVKELIVLITGLKLQHFLNESSHVQALLPVHPFYQELANFFCKGPNSTYSIQSLQSVCGLHHIYFFSQSFTNVNTSLSLQAVQKQATGHFCPIDGVCGHLLYTTALLTCISAHVTSSPTFWSFVLACQVKFKHVSRASETPTDWS